MKNDLFEPKLDLGVRRLVHEWRAMLQPRYLREDIVSGLTVACIAIPLSLAIALASGVSPGAGLFTAIVAGIVCAFFGGTPLAVSGPAAAMAVLVASVVQTYGIGGLLCVGLLCGVLQVLTGALGLGKVIRLVPVSVVEGFTAGIGAIILIGQLPRVLGLPPPEQSHVLDVVTHIRDLLYESSLTSILIAAATVALVFGLPKIHPRIPAPLLGVVVPTIAVTALGLSTATIGAIPSSLPAPTLPAFPQGADAWGSILGTAFVVYALASLESLLSSSAADKLTRGTRHDPDQELIGQGVGNVAAAVMGGIPVTGVIARTALNIQAGARTRRAAIVHSLVLLASVFLLGRYMAFIPIAALAGVLVSVALRMLDPRKLRGLWRVSRPDALIYVTTFAVIVAVDLIKGVQWGIAAALVIAAIRLGQTRMRLLPKTGANAMRLELSGPVTFMASLKIDRLRSQVEALSRRTHSVLDLSGVTEMDATGAEMVVDLVGTMKSKDVQVAVWLTDAVIARRLAAADHTRVTEGIVASTEQEIVRILSASASMTARQRLMFGVEHYRRVHLPRYTELFESLAHRQSPHTLFITCSDSRIQPALMTSTDPGELFIIRNVGNMVPRYSEDSGSSPGAGLEYAVANLEVSEIVVCAHSRCGAINALMHPEKIPARLKTLLSWLDEVEARDLCANLPTGVHQDDVARMNALLQMDHIRTYPVVRERLASKTLHLSAWFFHVATGEIEEYDAGRQQWVPLGLAPPESPESASRPNVSVGGVPAPVPSTRLVTAKP